jgi:NADPH2:quinone reductase
MDLLMMSFMTSDVLSAHEPQAVRRGEAGLHELLASRRVTPHIGASFDLSEAASALGHIADSRAIGKVALRVRPGMPG